VSSSSGICRSSLLHAALLALCRSLLELDFEEAERIEAEVMQQGAAYSI
jgi:hypothetical protein